MKPKISQILTAPIQILLSNDSLKHSFTICQSLVQELMTKIFKQLPPHQELLMQFSGLIYKNTTAKLVDVNLLQSQTLYCPSDKSITLPSKPELPQTLCEEQQPLKQKNFYDQPLSYQRKSKNSHQLSKSGIRNFKVKKPFKLHEDNEIHLQKDGIKLVKRQELKNLINHRALNSHHSLHQWTNIQVKNNEKAQKIGSKNSIHQNMHLHGNQLNSKNKSHLQTPESVSIHNKSAKSLSTLPGLQKVNYLSKVTSYEKQRISGVFNNASHFVNLKDYYKERGINSTLSKTTNQSLTNNFTHKSNPSNVSASDSQSANEPSWQPERQLRKPDETDVIINKLRQRKQKFYRTGIVNSNGQSFVGTKRENTQPLNTNQKGGSRDNQFGAMVTFDYSGEIMPTIKYDTLKMQAHYQEMEFNIEENDEMTVKKKERKGHMFRGAINLKLVDHQKFIPHPPQCKYEPLVEKVGMLMKQNITYSLKNGVELKAKQEKDNNNQSTATIAPETQINRAAFEFLYNDEANETKIKFQDFVKYKKSTRSTSSLNNKNTVSGKKLMEQKEESILSKKSIALKGWKSKQSKIEDTSNKVYKSENPLALEMLVNAAQYTESDYLEDSLDDERNKQNMVSTGILTKKIANKVSSKHLTPSKQQQKKKVRIA